MTTIAVRDDLVFDRTSFVSDMMKLLKDYSSGSFPEDMRFRIDVPINATDARFVFDFLASKGVLAKRVRLLSDFGPAAIIREGRIIQEKIDQWVSSHKVITL